MTGGSLELAIKSMRLDDTLRSSVGRSFTRRRATMIFLLACLAIFLTATFNAIATYIIVSSNKLMWAHSSGALVLQGKHQIAQTAVPEQAVPFIVAPLLSPSNLAKVKFMHVTRTEIAPNHVSGFTVVGFDWISRLQTVFHTSEGYSVHIDHGLTYLEWRDANGTVMREEVCSDNITCSAFNIDDIDVPTMTGRAYALLDAVANISTTRPDSDRRLTEDSAYQTIDHGHRLARARQFLGLESLIELPRLIRERKAFGAHLRSRSLGNCGNIGRRLSVEEAEAFDRQFRRALQDVGHCCPTSYGVVKHSCDEGWCCSNTLVGHERMADMSYGGGDAQEAATLREEYGGFWYTCR